MPAADCQPPGLPSAAPGAAAPAAAAGALVPASASQQQPQGGRGGGPFELLETFLAGEPDVQAMLLPSFKNVSTVHIQQADVINFISVQQWLHTMLGLKLQLLAGTIVTVGSDDLTAAAQQQLLARSGAGGPAPPLQQQQEQPCEAAVAAAVPLRLRQVAGVTVPAGAESAGQALVQLVGGGVVPADRLGPAALKDMADEEALCCELAVLQLAGVAPPLSLYGLAHTIWRLRLCAHWEDDIKRCNQEQEDLAAQGHDDEILQAAQQNAHSVMRDQICMLPEESFVLDIKRYVKLCNSDAAEREQLLEDLAAHWHGYVQQQLVAAQQPKGAQGSQQQPQLRHQGQLQSPGFALPPGLVPDAPKPLYNSWNTAVPPGLDMTLQQQLALAMQPVGGGSLSPDPAGLTAADGDDHGFFEEPFAAGPSLSPIKPLQAGSNAQLRPPQGPLGFGMAATPRAGGGLTGRQQRTSSSGGGPGSFAAGMAWHQQQQQQQEDADDGAPSVLQALMSKYSADGTGLTHQGSVGSNAAGGGAAAEGGDGGSDYMFWVKQGDISAAQNDPRTRRAHALMQSRGSGSYGAEAAAAAGAGSGAGRRGSGDFGSRLPQQPCAGGLDGRLGSGFPRPHAEQQQQQPWNRRLSDGEPDPLWRQHSRDSRGDWGGGAGQRAPPERSHHHHHSSGSRDREMEWGWRSSDGAAADGARRRSPDSGGRDWGRDRDRPAAAVAAGGGGSAGRQARHHGNGTHNSEGGPSRERSSLSSPVCTPRSGVGRPAATEQELQQHSGGSSDKALHRRSSSRDRSRQDSLPAARSNGRKEVGRDDRNRDSGRDRACRADRGRSRSRSRDRHRKRSRSRSAGVRGRARSRSPAQQTNSNKRQRPDVLELPSGRASASASPRSQQPAGTTPLSSPGLLPLDSVRRRFLGRLEGADSIFGSLSAAQAAERAVKEWLQMLRQLKHNKAGSADCVGGWLSLGYLKHVLPVPTEAVDAYGSVYSFLKGCPAVQFNKAARLVSINDSFEIEAFSLPASPSPVAAAAAEGEGEGFQQGQAMSLGSRGQTREDSAGLPGDREQQERGGRRSSVGAADGEQQERRMLEPDEADRLIRGYTSDLVRELAATPGRELPLRHAAGLMPPVLQRYVRSGGPIDLPKFLEDHVPYVEVVHSVQGGGTSVQRLPPDTERRPLRTCAYWDPATWGKCFKGARCKFRHDLVLEP